MRPKLLADENIPWPLVKTLRKMEVDIAWLPETDVRGASDEQVITLANSLGRTILTRDKDFMKPRLWRRAMNGVIYVGEPVTKENTDYLARNIVRVLESITTAPFIAVVASNRVEIYRPEYSSV